MFSLRRSKLSTRRSEPSRSQLTLEILEDRTLLDATPAIAVTVGSGGSDVPPKSIQPPSPSAAILAVKGDILNLGLEKKEMNHLLGKVDAALTEYTKGKLDRAVDDLNSVGKMVQHKIAKKKLGPTKAAAVMADTHIAKVSMYDGITAGKVKSSAEQLALDNIFSDIDGVLTLDVTSPKINELEKESIKEINLIGKGAVMQAVKLTATMKSTLDHATREGIVSAENEQRLLADVTSVQEAIQNVGVIGGSGGLSGPTGVTTIGDTGTN